MAYAETSMSRRKFLLHYFGEEYDEVNGPGAQNCDNMTNPPKLRDGQEEVHLILSAVLEHKQTFRAPFYTGMLCGQETEKSKTTKAPRARSGNGVRNTTKSIGMASFGKCSSSGSCAKKWRRLAC